MAEPMKRVPFDKTLTPDMRPGQSADESHATDEADGGADSSPHDTEQSGYKPPREFPKDDRSPCQQPKDW